VVASISTARRLSSVLCGTLFLNREKTRGGWFRFLSNQAMRAAARRFLDDIGVDIPSVDTPVAKLSGGPGGMWPQEVRSDPASPCPRRQRP
jgi:ABC-type sugar transport system ATPase subunit